MPYKALIVGLGQIGMEYDLHLDVSDYVYSHARALSQHPSFSLVAGVDIDEQRQRRFEQIYTCPAYPSVYKALQNHQPDVVILAVPTEFHGEALLQVLSQSHPKLILCEKPLSYSVNEAELMVKVCHERGVLLYVNYMRRSDPGVIEIMRRLNANEIMKPVKGVVWYSKGFLHNGSHFFNLLTYWLGPFKGAIVLNSGRLLGNNDQEPDIHAVFDGGSILFLAAWEEAFSHYTIELLSPNGRLRYERGGEDIQWERLQPDPYFQGYTTLVNVPEKIHSGMKRYQWHVVEALAGVLEKGSAHLCSALDALDTLKKMQQILESSG